MSSHPKFGPQVSEFAFAEGVATPRKQPVQGRSKHTVTAILQATLQVLDELGSERLTTTRVAEVAGVSVGTLYQYFPNREALLNALLADHIEAAVIALETAAVASAGLPIDEAARRVVGAFLAEKARRVEAARIMNKAFGVGMLDHRPLLRPAAERAHRAVAGLFGIDREDAMQRAEVACDAVEGMVVSAIERDPEKLRDPAWVEQVIKVARAAFS